MSQAFDSIDHLLLLTKLLTLGLSRGTVEWFKIYLSGRTQVVRIGSMLSEPLPVAHEVPQGSILCPALSNIYINDLPLIPTIGSLESFVDDSKLIVSFPIKNIDVVTQLTEDLRKIAAWRCTNSFLINPEKTKLLLLGRRQMLNKVPDSFRLEILGKQLYPSPFAKDLGVTIDASLTFDEHVTNLVCSCTRILCQINRAKYLLDKQTMSIIINALVFIKLYYCFSVWGNTSKKNLDKLQKVQNFAAQILSGTKKFHNITPILKELNWLPVHLNVKLRKSVMTFKCQKPGTILLM